MDARARPRSILVATDLSRTAGVAVRWAAAVAERAGAELHVIHALDVQPLPDGPVFLNGIFPELLVDSRDALERHLAGLELEMEPASTEVGLAVAYRTVLERAVAVAADLIVLGPHRGGGAPILGSTADSVVRRASCPVLVTRGEPSLPLERVVVPTDLSAFSVSAVEVAAAWVGWLGPGARLDLLYVIPELFSGDERILDRNRLLDELEAAASAAASAPGLDATGVEAEVVEAESPAAGVIHYAEWRDADLIVMATHGRGAVTRALVGSVASRVARKAAVPVLLVPPKGLE